MLRCDYNNVDGHIIGNVPKGLGAKGKLRIDVGKIYSNISKGCGMFLFYLKLADEELREQAALERQLTDQEDQLDKSRDKYAQGYVCSEQARGRYSLSPVTSCTGYKPDLPPFIGEDDTSIMYVSGDAAYITVPGGTTIPCNVSHRESTTTTTTTTTPEATTTSPLNDVAGWIGLGAVGLGATVAGIVAVGVHANNQRKYLQQQHPLQERFIGEPSQSGPSAA